jgi:hypothetical protein
VKRLVLAVALLGLLGLFLWLARDLSSESPAASSRAASAGGEGDALREVALPTRVDAELPAPVIPAATSIARPLAARLAGVVVRAADGSPLDTVRVVPVLAVPADGSARLSAALTRDGRFEFGADVVAQDVRALFVVWNESRSVRSVDSFRSENTGRVVSGTLELAEVTTPLDELRILLDTGWIACGRVVDPSGNPVGRIIVEPESHTSSTLSKPDGSFVVHDLPWDQPVVLVARRKGWFEARVPLRPPERPLSQKTTDIQIVQKP